MDSQTIGDITTSFNSGMQAFEKHEWAGAISSLEKAISLLMNYPDKTAIVEAKKKFAPV